MSTSDQQQAPAPVIGRRITPDYGVMVHPAASSHPQVIVVQPAVPSRRAPVPATAPKKRSKKASADVQPDPKPIPRPKERVRPWAIEKDGPPHARTSPQTDKPTVLSSSAPRKRSRDTPSSHVELARVDGDAPAANNAPGVLKEAVTQHMKQRFALATKKLREESLLQERRLREVEERRARLDELSNKIRRGNRRRVSISQHDVNMSKNKENSHSNNAGNFSNEEAPLCPVSKPSPVSKASPSSIPMTAPIFTGKTALDAKAKRRRARMIADAAKKRAEAVRQDELSKPAPKTSPREYGTEQMKAYMKKKKMEMIIRRRQERKEEEQKQRHRLEQLRLAEEIHRKGARLHRLKMQERRVTQEADGRQQKSPSPVPGGIAGMATGPEPSTTSVSLPQPQLAELSVKNSSLTIGKQTQLKDAVLARLREGLRREFQTDEVPEAAVDRTEEEAAVAEVESSPTEAPAAADDLWSKLEHLNQFAGALSLRASHLAERQGRITRQVSRAPTPDSEAHEPASAIAPAGATEASPSEPHVFAPSSPSSRPDSLPGPPESWSNACQANASVINDSSAGNTADGIDSSGSAGRSPVQPSASPLSAAPLTCSPDAHALSSAIASVADAFDQAPDCSASIDDNAAEGCADVVPSSNTSVRDAEGSSYATDFELDDVDGSDSRHSTLFDQIEGELSAQRPQADPNSILNIFAQRLLASRERLARSPPNADKVSSKSDDAHCSPPSTFAAPAVDVDARPKTPPKTPGVTRPSKFSRTATVASDNAKPVVEVQHDQKPTPEVNDHSSPAPAPAATPGSVSPTSSPLDTDEVVVADEYAPSRLGELLDLALGEEDVDAVPEQSDPKLSPHSLERKLVSELRHLEELDSARLQIAELEHAEETRVMSKLLQESRQELHIITQRMELDAERAQLDRSLKEPPKPDNAPVTVKELDLIASKIVSAIDSSRVHVASTALLHEDNADVLRTLEGRASKPDVIHDQGNEMAKFKGLEAEMNERERIASEKRLLAERIIVDKEEQNRRTRELREMESRANTLLEHALRMPVEDGHLEVAVPTQRSPDRSVSVAYSENFESEAGSGSAADGTDEPECQERAPTSALPVEQRSVARADIDHSGPLSSSSVSVDVRSREPSDASAEIEFSEDAPEALPDPARNVGKSSDESIEIEFSEDDRDASPTTPVTAAAREDRRVSSLSDDISVAFESDASPAHQSDVYSQTFGSVSRGDITDDSTAFNDKADDQGERGSVSSAIPEAFVTDNRTGSIASDIHEGSAAAEYQTSSVASDIAEESAADDWASVATGQTDGTITLDIPEAVPERPDQDQDRTDASELDDRDSVPESVSTADSDSVGIDQGHGTSIEESLASVDGASASVPHVVEREDEIASEPGLSRSASRSSSAYSLPDACDDVADATLDIPDTVPEYVDEAIASSKVALAVEVQPGEGAVEVVAVCDAFNEDEPGPAVAEVADRGSQKGSGGVEDTDAGDEVEADSNDNLTADDASSVDIAEYYAANRACDHVDVTQQRPSDEDVATEAPGFVEHVPYASSSDVQDERPSVGVESQHDPALPAEVSDDDVASELDETTDAVTVRAEIDALGRMLMTASVHGQVDADDPVEHNETLQPETDEPPAAVDHPRCLVSSDDAQEGPTAAPPLSSEALMEQPIHEPMLTPVAAPDDDDGIENGETVDEVLDRAHIDELGRMLTTVRASNEPEPGDATKKQESVDEGAAAKATAGDDEPYYSTDALPYDTATPAPALSAPVEPGAVPESVAFHESVDESELVDDDLGLLNVIDEERRKSRDASESQATERERMVNLITDSILRDLLVDSDTFDVATVEDVLNEHVPDEELIILHDAAVEHVEQRMNGTTVAVVNAITDNIFDKLVDDVLSDDSIKPDSDRGLFRTSQGTSASSEQVGPNVQSEAAAIVRAILDANSPIDWRTGVLSVRDLPDTRTTTAAEACYRRMLFDLTQEVIQAKRPFGGRPAPEPWHTSSRRNLKDYFWRAPTTDTLCQEVVALVQATAPRPDGALVFDDINAMVDADVRNENPEWVGFDEQVASIKFEIADRVFDDLIIDLARELRSTI